MVFFQSCCFSVMYLFSQGLWVFYLVSCRQKASVLVLCLYSIYIVSLACLYWLGVGVCRR